MTAAISARKWSAVVVLVFVGLLLVVALAGAEDRMRVDLFDAKARRTGYAIVDRESGRVGFYDVKSSQLGWGRITCSGRVERFDLEDWREGTSGVPTFLPPEKRARRTGGRR